MFISKTKNIIVPRLLLLVFLFYLSIRYSHTIIIIHDFVQHTEKDAGFNITEKFDCSLFHDLLFEFNKEINEERLLFTEIFDSNNFAPQIILIKLFRITINPRAPPIFY